MELEIFLSEFQQANQEWDSLLGQIPLERMTHPGAAGEWSVKDIVAHITWYENEMVVMLRERALAGSPLWQKLLDERNALIHARISYLSTDDVLKEAQQAHAEVWRLVQQLSEDELNYAAYFKDMPPEDHPRQYIVSNTYEHYRDHLPDLRRVIDSGKGD
jgi:hypothetical protein